MCSLMETGRGMFGGGCPVLRIRITADPDPACHFDPDSTFHFAADQDPTFHFDPDPNPDPDPSFQIKAQNLEKKCSNRLIFHTLWLVIRKLRRIWIQPNILLRRRVQLITLMRIRIRILPFHLKWIRIPNTVWLCMCDSGIF